MLDEYLCGGDQVMVWAQHNFFLAHKAFDHDDLHDGDLDEDLAQEEVLV